MEFWSTLPYNLKFGEILGMDIFLENFWLERNFGGFGEEESSSRSGRIGLSFNYSRDAYGGRIYLNCSSLLF